MEKQSWFKDRLVIFVGLALVVFVTLMVRDWSDTHPSKDVKATRFADMRMPTRLVFLIEIDDEAATKPTLILSVWHQNPGNLNEGMLQLELKSAMIDSQDRNFKETFSFEIWQPNRPNLVKYSVPLSEYRESETVTLDASVFSKNYQAVDVSYYLEWKQGDWDNSCERIEPLEKLTPSEESLWEKTGILNRN